MKRRVDIHVDTVVSINVMLQCNSTMCLDIGDDPIGVQGSEPSQKFGCGVSCGSDPTKILLKGI